MLLSEFKSYLANGELSQLNLGEDLTSAAPLAKLISGINLGLTELHKRFPIKVKEVTIPLVINTYQYAVANDLQQIVAIFDDEDEEIVLNDGNAEFPVFIIGVNTIKCVDPSFSASLRIQYKATPTKLANNAADNTPIEVPDQFIEALVNYVAYRAFAAINMNSAEAVNYYAKFEAACALINNYGLWDKSADSNERLTNAGWL
jgi:hypothetical protein